MKLKTYTTNGGKKLQLDENGLDEWGLPFMTPVKTPLGSGKVAGSYGMEMYVILDADAKTQNVMTFSLEDIGTSVVSMACTPPKVKAHPLKTISFRGKLIQIIMQKERGPCPIFAVANALALLGKIELTCDYGSSIKEVTLNNLLSQYFRSHVDAIQMTEEVSTAAVAKVPVNSSGTLAGPSKQKSKDEEGEAKVEETAEGFGAPKKHTLLRTLSDKKAYNELLKKFTETDSSPNSIEQFIDRLYDGLDIDVIFSGPEEFMMDTGIAFFSLFQLRIFHAWVIGKYMAPFLSLRDYSYNELTTMLVTSPLNKNTNNTCDTARQLGSSFYETTSAVQMTTDGFYDLVGALKEKEVGVLFWQNHFFTVTKMNDRLLVLLTDDSFRLRPAYVFATISCADFTLSEFSDSHGRPVDEFIAYISSNSPDDFTDEQITQAKETLRRQQNDRVTPQQVLEYLLTYPGKPKWIAEPQRSVGRTSEADAVRQYCDIFPEVSAEQAKAILRECGMDVKRAVEKSLS